MLAKFGITLLAITSCLQAFSQNIKLSGVVTGADKSPLVGVTVRLKQNNKSTKTDNEGRFSFSLKTFTQDSLVCTSVGYESTGLMLTNTEAVMVTMKESVTGLNDVVVVGYGTQKKKDVTGSVVSVAKERLENLPNNSYQQAIQGSVPGVVINTNSTNAEGNGTSMIIRGRGSISANNSPLIIVDGVIYTGGMSEINPNDIETIDVLKDASSVAIYGSRGANGVVLITTKQGKKGKMIIKYDASFGIQELANVPKLMTGEEFYKFKSERIVNIDNSTSPATIIYGASLLTPIEIDNYNKKRFTNWYDLVSQRGARQQHTLSLSGSNEKSKYYFSVSSLNATGIARGDQFKRYTLRSNVEYKSLSWLTLSSNTQLSYNNRDGMAADFSGSNGAIFMNPLVDAFDSNGNISLYPWSPNDPIQQAKNIDNPLSNLLVKNEDASYRIITGNSFRIDFPFVKGLSYKFNTGIETEFGLTRTYYGTNTATGYKVQGRAINSSSLSRNFMLENILTYSKDIGKHSLNLTALYSAQSQDYDRDRVTGNTFPSDVLTNYQISRALVISQTSTYYKINNISQMLRVNYGFDSKYLITLTGRRDGSSVFGSDTKYGFFPGVGLGWNIFREKFMEHAKFAKNLSNLKLRLSYGYTGNQALAAYTTLANLSTRSYISNDTTKDGVIPSKLANDLLGWESQTQFNAGLDVGLFKNKLNITFEYYNSNNYDLLFNRRLSPVMGISSVTQNIGKTNNYGFEFSIGGNVINKKDFQWTTQFNYSINFNKVVQLIPGQDTIVITRNGNSSTLFTGQPINVNFDYMFNGIYQIGDSSKFQPHEPGYVKIKSRTGDSVFNPVSDRTIIGQTDPKYNIGFANTFKYKRFTLYVFIHAMGGNIKENPLRQDAVGTDIVNNTTKKNWWTPTNPSNQHWANSALANPNRVKFYEDASFVRLKDITFSYDLPVKFLEKVKVSSCKLYLSARNLLTVTSYGGLDPELSTNNDTNTGAQWGVPLQKEYTLGLSVTF